MVVGKEPVLSPGVVAEELVGVKAGRTPALPGVDELVLGSFAGFGIVGVEAGRLQLAS